MAYNVEVIKEVEINKIPYEVGAKLSVCELTFETYKNSFKEITGEILPVKKEKEKK